MFTPLQYRRQDNVASVTVASYPVAANMFDGRNCAGPVPLVFSSDPDSTEVQILFFLQKPFFKKKFQTVVFYQLFLSIHISYIRTLLPAQNKHFKISISTAGLAQGESKSSPRLVPEPGNQVYGGGEHLARGRSRLRQIPKEGESVPAVREAVSGPGAGGEKVEASGQRAAIEYARI
jgi:hypothetical protein